MPVGTEAAEEALHRPEPGWNGDRPSLLAANRPCWRPLSLMLTYDRNHRRLSTRSTMSQSLPAARLADFVIDLRNARCW